MRSRTGVGRVGASVSAAAVELARDVAGPLAGRRVLVVGAGQSVAMSACALIEEGIDVVAGRHGSHAATAAGERGRGVALGAVPAELERADVVFTATACSRGRSSAGSCTSRRAGCAPMAPRPTRRSRSSASPSPRQAGPPAAGAGAA